MAWLVEDIYLANTEEYVQRLHKSNVEAAKLVMSFYRKPWHIYK